MVPSRVSSDQIAALQSTPGTPTRSPFGPEDEIGMLNLITPDSVARVLSAVDGSVTYDLSVDYFVGMPSWVAGGDPPFQICLTHTPRGNVADAAGPERESYREITYTGDAISMYTHCGTHIDALNHWGYRGETWNGFTEDEHLGSRTWTAGGVDKHPPLIARGVLIDVADAQGADVLEPSFGIGPAELGDALERQGTEVRAGDVVLIRTGRMRLWPDPAAYLEDEPGLTREGAEFLARAGAIVIGADTVGLEQIPSADPGNWSPVHTYLLAEAGVPILEVADLERLAADRLYDFGFIGACMRIRGATGAPIRPLAIPFR
jgi:kynurenine formamidase